MWCSPDAEVLYLIRAPKNKQVEEIYRRVNKIAEGAAHMTETRVEIDFVKGCSNLVSNKVIAKKLWENLTELGAPEYTKEEMELAQAIHDSVGESCYESIEKVAKTCDKETKKECWPTEARPCTGSWHPLIRWGSCPLALPTWAM